MAWLVQTEIERSKVRLEYSASRKMKFRVINNVSVQIRAYEFNEAVDERGSTVAFQYLCDLGLGVHAKTTAKVEEQVVVIGKGRMPRPMAW